MAKTYISIFIVIALIFIKLYLSNINLEQELDIKIKEILNYENIVIEQNKANTNLALELAKIKQEYELSLEIIKELNENKAKQALELESIKQRIKDEEDNTMSKGLAAGVSYVTKRLWEQGDSNNKQSRGDTTTNTKTSTRTTTDSKKRSEESK